MFRDTLICGLTDISGRYLGFVNISVSAKTADFIDFSRCWQNAVIFLSHPDTLSKKVQWTKSRQLSCSNASRCGFINKQTRWTMVHTSAVAAKKSIIINQINWKPRQNIEIATFWNILAHKSWFLKFMKKKVRHKIHKIHCIFDNEAENEI